MDGLICENSKRMGGKVNTHPLNITAEQYGELDEKFCRERHDKTVVLDNVKIFCDECHPEFGDEVLDSGGKYQVVRLGNFEVNHMQIDVKADDAPIPMEHIKRIVQYFINEMKPYHIDFSKYSHVQFEQSLNKHTQKHVAHIIFSSSGKFNFGQHLIVVTGIALNDELDYKIIGYDLPFLR